MFSFFIAENNNSRLRTFSSHSVKILDTEEFEIKKKLKTSGFKYKDLHCRCLSVKSHHAQKKGKKSPKHILTPMQEDALR